MTVVPSSGITIVMQEVTAIYRTKGRRRVSIYNCAIRTHPAKESSQHQNILEAPWDF